MVWIEERQDNKFHVVIQALKSNSYSYYPYMKSIAKFNTFEDAAKWAKDYYKNRKV